MADGRLPLFFRSGIETGVDMSRVALILTRGGVDAGNASVIRHVDAAARAQSGACACCRVPSDLVAALRRLVIDRARGDVDFASVLVEGDGPLGETE